MSYLVLHADLAATALTDDPIVPAADVAPVREALALLAQAGELSEAADRAHADARAASRQEGYDAGFAEGRAAGAADAAAELLRIADRDAAHDAGRRNEVAQLALGIVRRIADGLDGALVAGIAERALGSVAPGQAVVVRVAPTSLEAVRQRLAGRTGVAVEADGTLAAHDCMIETALGRVVAGLDAQLARIEQAWGGNARH